MMCPLVICGVTGLGFTVMLSGRAWPKLLGKRWVGPISRFSLGEEWHSNAELRIMDQWLEFVIGVARNYHLIL